jgi:hypothetical protein
MGNGLAQLIARPQIADIAGGQRQFESQQQKNLLFAQQQAEQARTGRARGLAGAALGEIPGIDQGLAQADPNLALSVFNAVGVAGEARQTQFREDVRVAAGLAQTNPQAAVQSIEQAIQRNEARDIPSPEMRQFLQEFQADPVTGAQNLQQLNQALKVPLAETAGQREFATTTAGFTEEEVAQAQRVRAGLRPRAGISAQERIAEDPALAKRVGESQAVIKEREEFGKKTGASRATAIDKGFVRVGKITQNIRNLDRAIKAVEAGAGTGAIERRFPSIRAASVELDQIQGLLALDVIGSVTFGALSEGELNLAKQIALPTGLDGPQLIAHLQGRQAAQTKLLNYFQEQIDFLDQGGSVAGFLREKQRQVAVTPPPSTGIDLQSITPDDLANLTDEQLAELVRGAQ